MAGQPGDTGRADGFSGPETEIVNCKIRRQLAYIVGPDDFSSLSSAKSSARAIPAS
jgi:hypothetical protein